MSVDYLTRPLEVFREMHRCLKPGGLAVMSFSNRCFPTKGECGGWAVVAAAAAVGAPGLAKGGEGGGMLFPPAYSAHLLPPARLTVLSGSCMRG